MMKQKELEMLLQKIGPHPDPSPRLEQYSTPATIAADALYFAYGQGDIHGKKVVDPGCGTGILAIGAKLLGARDVVALDLDEAAVEAAMNNADLLGADVCFLTMDFSEFPEKSDTVVMNPPFGAQKENMHADSAFLDRASEVGDVIYSFHKAETEEFIRKKLGELGRNPTHILRYRFPIPHMFDFHRSEEEEVEVVFLRMTR
jgi:putative methylase